MASPDQAASPILRWTGRIVGGLPALFLIFDGLLKLLKPAMVVDATVKLGYAESAILPIGATLIACTLLYLLPLTSVLGAVLVTGYLGGAVATHVRVGNGWFETLFPAIIACLLWLGLALREPRLRSILPFRR
jgi:hypothetical protein